MIRRSRTMSVVLLGMLSIVPLFSAQAASSRSHTSFTNTDRETNSSYRVSSSAQRRLGSSIVEEFPIPVLFTVTPAQITDTWGEARSEGRTHEGTDIFAPKGTPIVSPTKAIVVSIGQGGLGGNYVYTANPGGERYYFAHLDAYADGLNVGQTLNPGDVIGYVGNTGNAAGGPTHLHFGIYKKGATNPYPRLTKEFTLKEKIEAVKDMLNDAKDEDKLADQLVSVARSYFIQANIQGLDVPDKITDALLRNPAPTTAALGVSGLDLDAGSYGTRVILLQSTLIDAASGPAGSALAKAGAIGTFGPLTKNALIEYQKAHGIIPATGYFGPLTRAYFAAKGIGI